MMAKVMTSDEGMDLGLSIIYEAFIHTLEIDSFTESASIIQNCFH